ncbi:MAG: hypothetical protein SGILL_007867, partial [Bacillariaceae sp.]
MGMTTLPPKPKGYETMPEDDDDGKTYFLAKDGLYYESYRDFAAANRIYIHEYLDMKSIQSLKPPKKSPRATPRKRNKGPITPSRNSKRLKLVSPENPKGMSEEDLLNEEMEEQEKNARIKDFRTGETQMRRQPKPLTDEERAKMKDLPVWMEDFYEFLTEVQEISDGNCRSVMNQVQKMVTGVGITYHHWPNGRYFYRGTKIDLNFDFDELYHEAQDMENKYGRDLGNGWLVRHPLTKLKNFQQYSKGNGFKKKVKRRGSFKIQRPPPAKPSHPKAKKATSTAIKVATVPKNKDVKVTQPKREKTTETPFQLGTEVAKSFAHFGTVTESWTTHKGAKMWHVEYDDGDDEDMDHEEVVESIALHKRKGILKKTKKLAKHLLEPKVGAKVAKRFVHFGVVKEISTSSRCQKLYRIQYEDDDEEDLYAREL